MDNKLLKQINDIANGQPISYLHIPGAKDDRDKPRLDLVLGEFANALWEVGKVGTYGANKYTDIGWLEVDNAIERYSSAMLRHYLLHKQGEIDDRESHLPHLAHCAWNVLAVLQLYLDNNDREIIDSWEVEEE